MQHSLNLDMKQFKVKFTLEHTESAVDVFFAFAEQLHSTYIQLSDHEHDYSTFLCADVNEAGSWIDCAHGNKILFSLGTQDKFCFTTMLKVARAAGAMVIKFPIVSVNLHCVDLCTQSGHDFGDILEKFIINFAESLYCFDDFQTKKAPRILTSINIAIDPIFAINITNAIGIIESLAIVKDLGNNPSNVATPYFLTKVASNLNTINSKVSCRIFSQAEIADMGMLAFLGVAKGSAEHPYFIQLEYNNAPERQPIVLVGKGITFDTGGISLKMRNNMGDMRYDMCGAATVIGAFAAVAKLNLPVKIVGLIPTCENMPSGTAQKPGDIVTTMSGKTVEVLDTDAEGRLILCDALCYAKQFNPECVIDMATLTGACVIALGDVASGAYVNDEMLFTKLQQAATATDDKIWRMPLYAEYSTAIKGHHADLANLGGWTGKAGSITAACFLQEFIDYNWVHLDIAGTATTTVAKGSCANGRPLQLIVEFLRNYQYTGQ